MDPIIEALVKQRNTLAARCLDLELEVVARDATIAELQKPAPEPDDQT